MTMDISHLDDDALSASLDGDLEDAAGQSHLAGCATCSARRHRLAAARAALAAAPVEPVDELTRRRLVAAALEAAGPAGGRQAWYQRPALAGGVAAALLALLAAVPFVTGDRTSGNGDEAAGTSLETAGGEFLGDLGDLSDPTALRERFGTRSRALRAQPETAVAADSAAGSEAGSTPKAAAPPQAPVAGQSPEEAPLAADATAETYADGNQTTANQAGGAGLDRTVADACARTLAGGPAQGSSLLAVATGMYEGTPAVVAVFEDGAGTTAYVATRQGCRLLASYQV